MSSNGIKAVVVFEAIEARLGPSPEILDFVGPRTTIICSCLVAGFGVSTGGHAATALNVAVKVLYGPFL